MTKIREWIPALCLGIAAFVVVTTEFLPVGLLTKIAADFNISPARAGTIITLYAATVAVFSLPMAIGFAKFNRRSLLLLLLVLFMLGHLMVALAPSFNLLLAARVFIALAHALFWTMATPLSMRIAPKGQGVKALGLVITCTSLAAVMGVPIGTVVGNHFGWRIAFGSVILISLIVFLIMYFYMPSIPSKNSGTLKSLPMLFKRPQLMIVYLVFTLGIFGHYIAFAYFAPLMQTLGRFSADNIALLLLVFGTAGIVGSYFCTKYIQKHPFAAMLIPFIGVGLCLLLLVPTMQYSAAVITICFAWGAFLIWLNIACNNRALQLSHDAQDIAAALSNISFNLGVAGGAITGSYIFTTYGLRFVGFTGCAVLMLCVIIIISTFLLNRRLGLLKEQTLINIANN